MSFSVK